MHLSMLLDMAMAGHGDRVAFGGRTDGITYVDLATRAAAGAAHLREAGVEYLVYLAPNSTAFPVALFAWGPNASVGSSSVGVVRSPSA